MPGRPPRAALPGRREPQNIDGLGRRGAERLYGTRGDVEPPPAKNLLLTARLGSEVVVNLRDLAHGWLAGVLAEYLPNRGHQPLFLEPSKSSRHSHTSNTRKPPLSRGEAV